MWVIEVDWVCLGELSFFEKDEDFGWNCGVLYMFFLFDLYLDFMLKLWVMFIDLVLLLYNGGFFDKEIDFGLGWRV